MNNKRNHAKLYLAILITAFYLIFITKATFAASNCGEADTVLLQCDEDGEATIFHILSTILDIVSVGIGILAVIGISITGIQILTAGGNAEKGTKAKRRMTEIVIGIVCYIALFAALKWLLPTGIPSQLTEDTVTDTSTESDVDDSNISMDAVQEAMVGETFLPRVTIQGSDTTDDSEIEEDEDTSNNSFQLANATLSAKKKKKKKKKTKKNYSINSSNPSVATPLGKYAKCKSAGTVKLTAVTQDKKTSNTATVLCKDAPVTSTSATIANRTATDGGEIVGNMETTKLRNKTPHLRAETKSIIKKHNKDFYSKNYKKKIKKKGGLNNYIKNLGGVFTAYGGKVNGKGVIKRAKVKTAADVQAAAEYVWGLLMIWGPDYDNNHVHHNWKTKDAFYNKISNRNKVRGYSDEPLQVVLNDPNNIRTHCNGVINAFYKATTLEPIGGARLREKEQLALSKKNYPKNGGKITKWSELRVGDLVHFFGANKNWVHVALVGEVYSDYIVFYDGGSRFMKNTSYKFAVKRANDKKLRGAYKNYSRWWGFRPWSIDQSVTLKGIN